MSDDAAIFADDRGVRHAIWLAVAGILAGASTGLLVADGRHAQLICGLVFAAVSLTALVWRPDDSATLALLVVAFVRLGRSGAGHYGLAGDVPALTTGGVR